MRQATRGTGPLNCGRGCRASSSPENDHRMAQHVLSQRQRAQSGQASETSTAAAPPRGPMAGVSLADCNQALPWFGKPTSRSKARSRRMTAVWARRTASLLALGNCPVKFWPRFKTVSSDKRASARRMGPVVSFQINPVREPWKREYGMYAGARAHFRHSELRSLDAELSGIPVGSRKLCCYRGCRGACSVVTGCVSPATRLPAGADLRFKSLQSVTVVAEPPQSPLKRGLGSPPAAPLWRARRQGLSPRRRASRSPAPSSCCGGKRTGRTRHADRLSPSAAAASLAVSRRAPSGDPVGPPRTEEAIRI